MLENPEIDRPIVDPVVVTGATGGIGRCISRRLAMMRIPLILACRSEDRYAVVEAELRNDFPDVPVEYLHLDLADSRSVREATSRSESTSMTR